MCWEENDGERDERELGPLLGQRESGRASERDC